MTAKTCTPALPLEDCFYIGGYYWHLEWLFLSGSLVSLLKETGSMSRKWFITLQNKTLKESSPKPKIAQRQLKENHIFPSAFKEKRTLLSPVPYWLQPVWVRAMWQELVQINGLKLLGFLSMMPSRPSPQVSLQLISPQLFEMKGQCLLKMYLQNIPQSSQCFDLRGWVVRLNVLVFGCPVSQHTTRNCWNSRGSHSSNQEPLARRLWKHHLPEPKPKCVLHHSSLLLL